MKHLFLFLILSILSLSISAHEDVPDDIQYMLEDMYGANKNEWPSPRYPKDLNGDGFTDWVAIKKGCKLKKECPAELFICVPDKKGACSEYCYIEVKTLANIKKKLPILKCESTC